VTFPATRPDSPAARPDSRRLTPKGEATRARIVELATEVFATEGYASASVRDLAARSGLSVGAIYGAFRGKSDLLVEALEAHIAREIEEVPEPVLDRPLPEIDAYQYAHFADRSRLRTLLLEAAVAARSDTDTRSRVHDLIAAEIDVAIDAHAEWRDEAGVDPAVDLRALVLLLWSADVGLGVLEALGVAPPDADAWADVARRLLTSLQAPDAQPRAPSRRAMPSQTHGVTRTEPK
jgi:AcrR family transcriptional regulator